MRNWVVEQLKSYNITENIINDIKITISEALTNIYRYAYSSEIVKPVRIKISIDETKVIISLRDFGKTFDLENYVSPDLNQASKGGYGIYIIFQLMDGVEYIPHEIGTELIMWKSRIK